jgi:hypothetical protein
VTVQFLPTTVGTLTCAVQTGVASCSEVPCTGVGDVSIPIVLQGLDARWSGNDVEVSWTMPEAMSNLTFEVARQERNAGPFVRSPQTEIIEEGNQFVFHDRSTAPETTYTYRIIISRDGSAVTSFETTVTTPAMRFVLEQNRPNPFNPSTEIAFQLRSAERVRLKIYDVSGRLVRVLLDENRLAGRGNVIWNGVDDTGRIVASGVYFCRMTAGPFQETRRMLLLK